jgi:NitT/TauT family transport system permease protein
VPADDPPPSTGTARLRLWASGGSNAWVGRLGRGLAGGLILLVVLEALTRAELVNPDYLPPATSIVATTVALLTDPEFLVEIIGTLQAWAIGLLVATAIAVPVGLVLGSSPRSYLASITVVEFLRPIPSVAIIPLAILIMGRGLDMRVTLVAYASLWPILFNTIYGMREVDPVARDTARVFGYGPVEVLRRVSIPSAAPFVYTGIRVAAAIALIVAISTELIAGGTTGLGVWMLSMQQTGVDRRFLYAGIVVAGLLGLLVNAILVAVERRLFHWHPRIRNA